ncbi:MAG: DMT family transporter [Alphaproteobacteria bacterium]|nr:DMT family transporter [Alphaproteobacteria bacterium]
MVFFRNNSRKNGVLIVVCGVMVLTPDGLLTTLISADIWTMLFWRGFLMAIALTIYSVLTYKVKAISQNFGIYDRETVKYTIAVALLFAISSISFVTAIVNTNVANTLFLITISPLFAAGFAFIFLREPVSKMTIIASLITIIGMAIIFGDGIGKGDLIGDLAAVLAAASWAGTLVILRKSAISNISLTIATGGYIIAVISLVFAPTLQMSTNDIIWVGLQGLIILPLSFGLISLGPKYLPASEVSLIVLLEAVFGPLWAWVFIKQLPSSASLIGGLIIIATLTVYFFLSAKQNYTNSS